MNEDGEGLGLAAAALVVIVIIILIGLLNLAYSVGRLIWG